MFTCVTLSNKELHRDTPSNVVYYNHVREFSDTISLHTERLNAISKVKTPYFFFCDYDDPLPEFIIKPNKAVLYGDNYFNEFGVERIFNSKEWSREYHLQNPYAIHKAICNTNLSRKLSLILPRGEYWTEILLYYSLALIGGFEYNKELKMIWNKKNNGFHTKVNTNIANSVLWLLNNEHMLKRISCI